MPDGTQRPADILWVEVAAPATLNFKMAAPMGSTNNSACGVDTKRKCALSKTSLPWSRKNVEQSTNKPVKSWALNLSSDIINKTSEDWDNRTFRSYIQETPCMFVWIEFAIFVKNICTDYRCGCAFFRRTKSFPRIKNIFLITVVTGPSSTSLTMAPLQGTPGTAGSMKV